MQTWTYDGIGNRTSAGSSLGARRPYTYFKNGSNPLNGQRLQSDGVSTYGYDANGNTTSRTGSPGAFTFGWDAEDRMISIAGGVSASYTYDYQGRRTRKTVGGVSSTYLYDGLNLVRTTGADQVDVLFGPGIDEPLAMAHNGSVYYFSVDGLGSVVLLTTSGGAVQNASLYDAWGERRHQSGSLPQPFAYTAREPAEAGLWFYRARYYQPEIGRFGSEDPLAPQTRIGTSDYAYVTNAPIRNSDPSGMIATPSPTPPRCDNCCDPKKIADAARKVREQRDRTRRGQWPEGTMGGQAMPNYWWDDQAGRWRSGGRPMPTYPDSPDDPCVMFCLVVHEMHHYFEHPPEGTTRSGLVRWLNDPWEAEGRAYDKQLRCLRSFGGSCPKVDPFRSPLGPF